MTNSAAHLQATVADRYVLERELDRGGMGQARERAELYVGEKWLGFEGKRLERASLCPLGSPARLSKGLKVPVDDVLRE